jgi:hypothetical protein
MGSVALSGVGEYRACPACRAFAPGRAFAEAAAALEFAREAADRHRVGYVVWQFYGASWRVIARVTPGTAKGVRS